MKLVSIALSTLLASSCLYASQITITGTQTQPLNIENNHALFHSNLRFGPQTIKLLNVQIPSSLKSNLKSQINKVKSGSEPKLNIHRLTTSKTATQLGMNGVPVLNQGQHGTCATFANTAAVDALLEKGDYVSQLCQLQLGNYLAENGYFPSGWNGSTGPIVLNQMSMFGVISKKVESQQGCGGLDTYPIFGPDPEMSMRPETYHNYSEKIADRYFSWSPILNMEDVMFNEYQSEATLEQVKNALSKGDRVTFGVLLFDFDLGTVGAVGSHHSKNDTWILTPDLVSDLENDPIFGGHEMIITGYDDNAIAKDKEGREYKGLLTLRNSWGKSAGNKGNFYMSYDYFKTLTIEAQRIRKVS